MKRIIWSVVFVLTLILTGCAQDPADYSELSPEDAHIRQIADAVVMEKTGISDLSCFEITIDRGTHTTVTYTFMLCGHETWDSVRVYIADDDRIFDVRVDLDTYYPFLSVVTENQFRAAEKTLWKQIEGYQEADKDHFYFSIQEDGALYLCAELIVEVEPDADVPCGDHEHLLFAEKICDAP